MKLLGIPVLLKAAAAAAVAAAAGLLLTAADSAGTTPERGGAIVLFVADDLGWNDVGWKNSALHTPTLDALRDESVELADYYVQQVCSPTRASLLSGRFPHHLGVSGVIHASEPTGVPLDVPMVSNALADSGAWDTHLLGKWHVGMFRPELLPINRGFSSAFGYLCGSTSYWNHGNTEPCPGSGGTTQQVFALDLTNGSAPATWV